MDIDELLAQLTVAEKASLTLGSDFWHTAPIERLDVPAVMVSDGPHGLRAQPARQDHVGLGGSLPATCFPTASALASSWDPEIFAEVGRALAAEALACGVSVVLGPGINMKRSPLCGRNFEYLSEDPWLAGVLATAMVDGVQSRGVGTSLKHFAANNQETDRLRVSAEVDERTLREIYLPAFEYVVKKAQPWTVMCAYNKVNGTYASEHAWLLTQVLREEWGFAGLVVSDWGAVHDRVAALRAGLDLEMPPNLGRSDRAVVAAIGSGELTDEQLDRGARRVLELVEKSSAQQRADFDVDAHHALAREAARRSAVLLKNDGGVLPLRPQPGQTVALIGRFATEPRFQGAGSSQVNATRIDNAADELAALVEAGVDVRTSDGSSVDDAVALARAADHVVVFLGLPETAESEGFDRTDLELPADQLDLLDAVVTAHPRTAVVLTNGSVVRVTPWLDSVPAVLETLAVRAGVRRRGGGPAARDREPVRQARRDDSVAAAGQSVLPELPGRLRGGALRRGHLHRLPRLRRRRAGRRLPVRVRAVVHDVRAGGSRCRCRRALGERLRDGHEHRRDRPGQRSCSSTCTMSSRR